MRSVVLCYHAVSPTWGHRLSLPAEQLLRQVRAVRRMARVEVTFDDAFRNAAVVIPQLLDLGIPVTVFVCSGYADRDGAPLLIPELDTDDPAELTQLQTMSWDELRALAAGGVAIGSHTVSHAHLPRLGNGELGRELREAKLRIEDELGRPCPDLAYPYGEHDPRVRDAARAAGYEQAFALRGLRRDRFAIPRVDLYRRDTLVRTVAKARPFRSTLQRSAGSAERHVRTP